MDQEKKEFTPYVPADKSPASCHRLFHRHKAERLEGICLRRPHFQHVHSLALYFLPVLRYIVYNIKSYGGL